MDDVSVAVWILEIVIMPAVIRDAVFDEAVIGLKCIHIAVTAASFILWFLEKA